MVHNIQSSLLGIKECHARLGDIRGAQREGGPAVEISRPLWRDRIAGRVHRSRKPEALRSPWVRIPLPPPYASIAQMARAAD